MKFLYEMYVSTPRSKWFLYFPHVEHLINQIDARLNLKAIGSWEHQRFLGSPTNFGMANGVQPIQKKNSNPL